MPREQKSTTVLGGPSGIWKIAATILAICALAYGGLWLLINWSDNEKLKFPTPTRDCDAANGRVLSSAELMDLAITRWKENSEVHGDVYRRRFIGGPVLRAKSTVKRLDTMPVAGETHAAWEIDTNPDLKMRYFLAKAGVRRYAVVTLVVKGPIDPDADTNPETITVGYDFGLCGARY